MRQPFQLAIAALSLVSTCGIYKSYSFAADNDRPAQASKVVEGPRLGQDPQVNSLLIDAWNALSKNNIHLALRQTDIVLALQPNNGQALLFKSIA
jgi:hypothetical protein